LQDEFIVNEHLSLKFERNKSIFYVNGKRDISWEDFIPEQDSKSHERANKSDPELRNFPSLKNKELEELKNRKKFEKYCRLLKKWVDNDYAPGILPRKITFRLLRLLHEAGFTSAISKLKKAIISELNSGKQEARKYIDDYRLLRYLDVDDIQFLLEDSEDYKAVSGLIKETSGEFDFRCSNKSSKWEHPIINTFLINNRKVIGLSLKKMENENLPENIWKLKHLRFLIISSVESPLKLVGIPEKLKNLSELEYLKISCDSIISVPEEIGNLENLRRLIIHSRQLSRVPSSIVNLKNLIELDISLNNLKKLPKNLSELKNLRKLVLGGNPLKKIPRSLAKLPKLKLLNLYFLKQLEKLPSNFGRLKNLRKLDMRYCENFHRLPRSFKKLNKLRFLNLGDCGLKKFPKILIKLKNLRILNLANNSLKCLPRNLGKGSSKIKVLKLKYNNLKKLSKSIEDLKYLKRLNVSENELINITDSIKELRYLELLDLSGNDLPELPDGLTKLKRLRILKLNSNKLNTLPESFGNLKNLKQLYIDYNHLTSLPESFGQLKNLKYLSLEKNPLQYVPDSFASLPKLSFLVVDNEIIKNLKNILKNQSIFNITFNSDRPEESFIELLKRGRI